MMTLATVRRGARLDPSSRVLLLVSAAAMLLVVLISILAPPAESDPVPTVWNTGRDGAKAALLLLQGLGYQASAFEQPLDQLPLGQAAHTTLILAEPSFSFARLPEEQRALDAFLRSGGVVLATGISGAVLLRQSEVRPSAHLFQSLCLTQPEGFSRLARVGSVRMPVPAAWGGSPSTGVEVAQRCGSEGVVVRWHPEGGTAVWWSSPAPLSNAGLHNAAALRLLLAGVAPGGSAVTGSRGAPGARVVLFDEYLHGTAALDVANPLSGLPLPLLLSQGVLVLLLLVFSFSRRHGPVRARSTAARTSPVEFATAMGALYQRAGAYPAAIDAARDRLLRALHQQAGVSHATIAEGPQAISDALAERYGVADAWQALAGALGQAATEQSPLRERDALTLVRALDRQTAVLADQRRHTPKSPAPVSQEQP